jgi:hypothetical protein
MISHIRLASMTAYSICDALIPVPGVNVAATAFPGGSAGYSRKGCQDWATVAPMLRHGQTTKSAFQMRASGNTPLAEALWWVTQEMVPLRESRKMVVIVTDGQPDSRENALEAIKAANKRGIETYGLGLGNDSVRDLMPNRAVCVNNLMELPRKLFWLLEQAIKFTY